MGHYTSISCPINGVLNIPGESNPHPCPTCPQEGEVGLIIDRCIIIGLSVLVWYIPCSIIMAVYHLFFVLAITTDR